MHSRTQQSLTKAMQSEAHGYTLYALFARRARRMGHPEVAELFELAADREFLDQFEELWEMQGTTDDAVADHLQTALTERAYGGRRSFRGFARQAEAAGDYLVAERLREMHDAEHRYLHAFRMALAEVEAGLASAACGRGG